MKLPVYLDNHATTPCDPRVLEAMLPYFSQHFGNPVSRHASGKKALAAVERSRGQVGALIGAESRDILFTSGATESINLAIFGVARAYRERGNHIVSSPTEHKAVLNSLKALEGEGFEVTYLSVDRNGAVDLDEVRSVLRDSTTIVSLMGANNEIGTIHPIAQIGEITRSRGVLFHCDAAQAIGKLPVDVDAMGIDLLSLSSQKIYGPKGVGALYVRGRSPRVRLSTLLYGAGQERGLRPGTLNVPGIVGLGEASEISGREMAEESARLEGLRSRLSTSLLEGPGDVVMNGHPTQHLPNNLSVSFQGVDGEVLIASLENVCVSSGAACTSTSVEPSHVLKAIGVSDAMAVSTIRFGLGRFTTEEEIDFAAGYVSEAVQRLRAPRKKIVGRSHSA